MDGLLMLCHSFFIRPGRWLFTLGCDSLAYKKISQIDPGSFFNSAQKICLPTYFLQVFCHYLIIFRQNLAGQLFPILVGTVRFSSVCRFHIGKSAWADSSNGNSEVVGSNAVRGLACGDFTGTNQPSHFCF